MSRSPQNTLPETPGYRTDSLTSRRGFATLCLTALTATAGCLDFFGDDSNDGNGTNGDETESFAIVPGGIDGVLVVDDRMVEDDSARIVMEGIIEHGTAVVDDGGTIVTYRELLVELGESEVDHDHSTLFYRDDESGYTALVIETDDDQEAAVEHVRNRFEESEETSEGDVDVIVGERNGETEWLAPIGEESLVVGTESAVADSLDVYRGDADPFAGEVRAAHEQASDGEMKATMALEDGQLEEIVGEISPEFAGALGLLDDPEILTVTYRAVGDQEVVFDMQLTMASADEAEQFQGTVELFIDDDNGLPIGDDVIDDELLDALSVSQSDEYVTLTMETETEELASYFE